MALATYANLKAAVAAWLSRADQTTNIVDFITLAHDKLMRTLRTREMETIDTAMSISAETNTVPTLWLETRNIVITSTAPRYELAFVTPEQLITKNSSAATSHRRRAMRLRPTPTSSPRRRCSRLPSGASSGNG